MISDKRLLLTAHGRVVEDGDPAGEYLLVGKGCHIADPIARACGLLPAAEETPVRPTAVNGGNIAGLVPQSTGDPLQDLLAAKLAENIAKNQSAPAPTSQDLGVTQAEAENGANITTAPAEVSVAADAEAEAVTVGDDNKFLGDGKSQAEGDNKAVTSDKAVKSSENK